MERRNSLKTTLLAVLMCGCGFKSVALTNLVVNGSFDQGGAAWEYTGPVEFVPQGNHLFVYGSVWQDVPTVPGRDYIVRFAAKYAIPRLHWGSETYTTFTNVPAASTWTHVYRFVRATSSVTRLMFENFSGNFGVDDVVVGWLGEPASIVTPPQNRSAPEGGSGGFTVVADGGPPLSYQWFHEDQPLEGATNHYFIKHSVTAADAGVYHVIVGNSVNAVTSPVVRLTVDSSPKEPQIVLHPESQEIPAGYAHALRTVATGTLPLSYQWFFNGSNLDGATNATLGFSPADYTNSGSYTVRVSNQHGSAMSLAAKVNVYTLTNPGGYVTVNTFMPQYPAFDVDGYTRLNSNYVAQLYVGPTPVLLRPVGALINFLPFGPGCLNSGSRAVPDVPPGELVYGQLRVWERAAGSSYEEGRARGGKFGFSPLVSVIAGPPLQPPGKLPITSFGLRYGLPEFTTGQLEVSRRLPNGGIEWRLRGEPGFRYLVEKRLPPHNWEPLAILTNDTGEVTFSDPAQQNSSVQFYRSRMLE